MADKVDPLLKSLQKNSAIRQLHEYREKYLESIQNPDRQRDLIRLKDQLNRFLAHKKHHYILKREADFLLKQITQFESHSI